MTTEDERRMRRLEEQARTDRAFIKNLDDRLSNIERRVKLLEDASAPHELRDAFSEWGK